MTQTACPPRPCARAKCKKLLHSRVREKPLRFQQRRFCSQECRLKCRRWGATAEAERTERVA